MYIAQAFKGLYDSWRYLVGTLIIFILWQFIGAIPLGIAILFKVLLSDGVSAPTDIPQMIEVLGSNLFLFLMLLSFAVGLIGVLLTSKLLHKQTFTSLTTARAKIDWKRFWFVFILWGIISSSFVLIDYFFISPENYVLNFNLKPFLILCVIGVLLIPLQTSFEEYFFRGYLLQGLAVSSLNKKFPFIIIYLLFITIFFFLLNSIYHFSFWETSGIFITIIGLLLLIINTDVLKNMINTQHYNVIYKLFKRNSTPLIITSIGFGLMHIFNPEVEKLGYIIMVYYIGTGLFWGIITLMDEGLELALGFHAANNLFTALLVTADWTAFQTHSVLKDMSDPSEMGLGEIFIPVFVVYPILLFILSKKYNWTNWKEKLFGKVVEPIKLNNQENN
jgi:membrane protease YdiL (CAAX protease family)